MRTGVFVEERVESAARRLWKRSEAVGPPFGAGRVLSEPGLSGKGPGGGLWGSLLAPEGRHLLERLALGLGNHLPDEEGRQERHEGVDAVGAPTLQPLSDGKVAVTRKFETHCAATAMATACERIVLGKISEMSTQQMGSHDIMNEAV